MKRSITIINTEIQLINAIEAIHYFGCEENFLVIGQFNFQPKRIQKIENMLKEPLFRQHFKRIIHLPFYFSHKNPLRFIGYILAYIKFFFLILFSKKFDFCFFGVMTDIIVKPIAFLTQYKNPQCELCVIDEGIRIIADTLDRVHNQEAIIRQSKKKPLLLQGYYQAITKKWQYPTLTFYSIYQLSLLPQDRLIQNTYVFFKQNRLSSIRLDNHAVLLIGQPLFELHLMELSDYQKIIQQIVEKYKPFPVYYAPHPIETEYTKWLPDQVTVVKSQYPIELLIMVNQVDALIGFNSTALLNCASMGICDNIISISVENNSNTLSSETAKENQLQKEMTNLGINIVSLSFFSETQRDNAE